MKKILHVIGSINPEQGGPIEGIYQLNTALSKVGIISEILTLDSHETLNKSVTIYQLKRSYFKYKLNFELIPWLKKHSHNYDAIIVNGLWQFGGLATSFVLRKTKIPYFIFPHGMLDPWFKKKYRIKHFKKLIYWILFEKFIINNSASCFFTSKEEQLLASQSFPGYAASGKVIPYGTFGIPSDSGKYAEFFFQAYPNLKNKRIILFLSRIDPKKGCDLLILAMQNFIKNDSNLHLLFVGPGGEYKNKLLKLVVRLGISESVTWIDMVMGDLKWGAFCAAEVFCLPSHQENFGIVVVEALSCSKPVLISNKVNIWREIQSGDAGFVDDDTVEGVVHNIQKWLDLNRGDYQRMCQKARRCFEKNFHINNAGITLSEIIADWTNKDA